MAANAVDLCLISDRENFEYFSGYRSLFWASKARPFFLLVPREGETCYVIASASEARAFNQTEHLAPSLTHVPYSGFTFECVSAILETMARHPSSRIALDYGFECFGLGSLKLISELGKAFPDSKIIEGADLIWSIRITKSAKEISQKKVALDVATTSFMECLRELQLGTSEVEFAQALTLRLIGKGATSVPWLPVRFGRGNFAYSLPPTARKLASGDFVWVDIGCVVAESLSDINRIAKAGPVTAGEQSIYRQVRDMTIATLAAMKPGMTGSEAYTVFENAARASAIGLPSATASRIGHGSGTNLTEPPSISPTSNEVLQEGMLIHVEPKYEIDGGVYQLEEVAVITASGAEIISCVAEERFPEVGR
jgi:Xaa-Pro aminopeptidase